MRALDHFRKHTPIALALGLFVGFWGAALTDSLPTPYSTFKRCESDQQRQNCGAPKNNNRPFLLFVSDNHDAIEATASVAAVLAAIWLAVVTGYLWRATRDLAISTENLAKGAGEQVSEMVKTRELMNRQFLLSGRATDIADKAHQLNRMQFAAEHRPRLSVRSISVTKPNPDSPRMFEDGTSPRGSLVIVNTGGSEATIMEGSYRFYWSKDGLPMTPPLGEQVKSLDLVPIKIALGGSHLIPLECDEIMWSADDIERQRTVFLYIMGAILYSDFRGNERWMGFCSIYLPADPPTSIARSEGKFAPVISPDYEYQD